MKISRLVLIAGLVVPLFAFGCSDGNEEPTTGSGGSAGEGTGGKAGSGGKAGGQPGTGGEAGTAGAGGVAGDGGKGGSEISTDPCTKGMEKGSSCQKCHEDNCLDACQACVIEAGSDKFNQKCVDVADCLTKCSKEPQCEEQCLTNPELKDGLEDYFNWNKDNVFSCHNTRCGMSCNVDLCGGIQFMGECGECTSSKCQGQCTACVESPDCYKFLNCYDACGDDDDCLDACFVKYPEGSKLMIDWLGSRGSCAKELCKEECKIECNDSMLVTPECSKCSFEKCQAECNNCVNSDDCWNYMDCTDKCADDDDGCFDYSGCMATCDKDIAAGKALFDAWIGQKGCVETKCLSECRRKECSEGMLLDPACDKCNVEKCLPTCNACIQSDTCLNFWDCVDGCHDIACEQQCSDQFPGGRELLLDWLGDAGCVATQCEKECSGGSTPTECSFETLGGTGNPACGTCNCDKCRTQCDACIASKDCQAVVQCLSKCVGDKMCSECKTTNPTGAALYDAWTGSAPDSCTRTNCAAECH